MNQAPHDVGLDAGQVTLLQQLRPMLANPDKVLPALLQDARRAQATMVTIHYDAAARTLDVFDNGLGVMDFQALIAPGESGWGLVERETEAPSGVGFLSAVFASQEVEVASGADVLRFDSARLLAGERFMVNADALHAPREDTRVTLKGFMWPNEGMSIARMVTGFPMPVSFNGKPLLRRDATHGGGTWGELGTYLVRGQTFTGGPAAVYLGGLCVYRKSVHLPTACQPDVVHLDPAKFKGKMLGGACATDQAEMLAAVEVDLRRLYEERLARMKQELEPLAFCEMAYDLALSLQRLDVFNDIDVVPASWLGVFTKMPHTTPLDGETLLKPLALSGRPSYRGMTCLCRQEAQSGHFVIANLSRFDAWDGAVFEGTGNQLANVLAYASKALCPAKALHPEHWLVAAATITDFSEVVMEVDGASMREAVSFRADVVAGTGVLLWQSVRLTCGLVSESVIEPMGAIVDGDVVILVPLEGQAGAEEYCGDALPAVRQCFDYVDDGVVRCDMARNDAHEVCNTVRAMLVQTPEARVALALDQALARFGEFCGMGFHVEVGADGKTTVTDFKDRRQASSVPAGAGVQ